MERKRGRASDDSGSGAALTEQAQGDVDANNEEGDVRGDDFSGGGDAPVEARSPKLVGLPGDPAAVQGVNTTLHIARTGPVAVVAPLAAVRIDTTVESNSGVMR